MSDDLTFWKRCSNCKKEIGFLAAHYVCSVSTCNRPRTALAFCSIGCWDAHVPMIRHRDAWAEEAKAPSKAQWERQLKEAAEKDARKGTRRG